MDADQAVTRRTVLAGGIAVAGAATALAGCASSSGSTTPSTAGAGSPGGTSAPANSGAAGLIKLADVPVGGSASAQGADGGPVLVAQPTAGTVVAFTAVCTHMGCTVKPAGKEFHCPCHGSVYDAFTGKVLGGPAPAPLAAVPVKVTAGEVVSG